MRTRVTGEHSPGRGSWRRARRENPRNRPKLGESRCVFGERASPSGASSGRLQTHTGVGWVGFLEREDESVTIGDDGRSRGDRPRSVVSWLPGRLLQARHRRGSVIVHVLPWGCAPDEASNAHTDKAPDIRNFRNCPEFPEEHARARAHVPARAGACPTVPDRTYGGRRLRDARPPHDPGGGNVSRVEVAPRRSAVQHAAQPLLRAG